MVGKRLNKLLSELKNHKLLEDSDSDSFLKELCRELIRNGYGYAYHFPSEEDFKIEYDGKWPSLCHGSLKVTVYGKEYDLGRFLASGGECRRNSLVEGEWGFVYDYESIARQAGFPMEWLPVLLEVINNNEEIPKGCCGGCR